MLLGLVGKRTIGQVRIAVVFVGRMRRRDDKVRKRKELRRVPAR